MSLKQHTIKDIVEKNYEAAITLYEYKIYYASHLNMTLSEVCKSKGISLDEVVKSLVRTYKKDENNAIDLPLTLSYLREQHQVFLNDKIPFINKGFLNIHLANQEHIYDLSDETIEELAKIENNWIVFCKSFRHHVEDEEKRLFLYIELINNADQGKYNFIELYKKMADRDKSLFDKNHHAIEVDSLKKIVSMLSNMQILDHPILNVLKFIMADFLKSIEVHSHIENEILIPDAQYIEQEVTKMLDLKILEN